MRYRWMRRALVLATSLFLGVAQAKAQSTNNYDFSGTPQNALPLPIGPDRASDGGFFTAIEAVMMKQDRALGSQTIAVYGFRDSLGAFTGTPGAFVGSG